MSLFDVHAFYKDGTNAQMNRNPLDAESAVRLAKQTTDSVAARTGLIHEVTITDDGDCTAFKWVHGQGVVFPPRP